MTVSADTNIQETVKLTLMCLLSTVIMKMSTLKSAKIKYAKGGQISYNSQPNAEYVNVSLYLNLKHNISNTFRLFMSHHQERTYIN
jgi:hypothetical protein